MKKQAKRVLILLAILSGSVSTYGANYIIDISDSSNKSSGDLVLNLADSSIHVPPALTNYQPFGSGTTTRVISVGDGSNGKFDSSTYANFSVNGDTSGNIITIDTDTYTSLNFTSFTLDAGWTIRPTGSNPLIIYSQSTVYIDGTINCSGTNGSSGDADETVLVSGPTGVCGGADGGAGGYHTGAAYVNAVSGSGGGTSVTGGGAPASDATTGGKGGAGGGAYSQAGTGAAQGTNPDGGSSGTAGTNFRNDEFTESGGGSGGSGGAAFAGGTATQNSSGASGGAGGGYILISAFGDVTITDNGSVLANGGDGGSVSGGLAAGAGGGGGGGSIAIFSAGSIIVNNTVSAVEGSGGTSTGGGNGGNGGRGRTWVVDNNGTASGDTFENPNTQLVARGSVLSSNGTYTLESVEFDLENTAPIPVSDLLVTSSVGSSTVTLEYASDEESGFSPTYSSASSFSESNSYRYQRVKLTLNQDTSGDFTKVTQLGYEYTPKSQAEFDMVAACGLVKNNTEPPFWFFLLFSLPMYVYLFLRFRKFTPAYS